MESEMPAPSMRLRSDTMDLVNAFSQTDQEQLLKSLQDEDEDVKMTPSTSRPIPMPVMKSLAESKKQVHSGSQGSSGSAFLTSVLNPNMSHTPPVPSSYEVSHFGKRARAGSISGRLGSATAHLKQRGIALDRATQGVLKDLMIIGDEELHAAMDAYENGDAEPLEKMVQTGALQDRLPEDFDILGDLELDFLTVEDDNEGDAMQAVIPNTGKTVGVEHYGYQNTITPEINDDGIGDLEFAGDLVTDSQQQQLMLEKKQQERAAAASPDMGGDARMRSNSLFCALFNDKPPSASPPPPPENALPAYWRDTSDRYDIAAPIPERSKPRLQRRASTSVILVKRKKRGIRAKKEKEAADSERIPHVPGSGRPRSLSDPNLRMSIDDDGLQTTERPDGWIGAYSPDSRKKRIEKFLKKRSNRVWTKTVKYDVRKNFADSRLRVKGRFVKKEEEVLMRELMSLT